MATLSHGENKEIEFNVDGGTYKLSFVNTEDSSMRYDEDLVVDSNMELSFRIRCYFDKIEVNTLYIDRDITLDENQIKIDFDNTKFSGKNYEDVIKNLKEIGFTNIEENPVYDIVFDITPEGEVDTVKINDKNDYRRGDIFNKDDKIIVSYHMKDDNDPNKSKAPYHKYSYGTVNYEKVQQAFYDAGFTNILLEVIKTEVSNYDGNVYSISIDGSEPLNDDVYSKDAEVIIKYYKYEKIENNSNLEKEDYSDNKHYSLAKKSFENMGESLYPYGIKFHWILGLRDFTYQGNGIWHIEVEVTITNQYNAKRKAIASGNVNFKTERVENFKVKNN